jgi:hypothetical protein
MKMKLSPSKIRIVDENILAIDTLLHGWTKRNNSSLSSYVGPKDSNVGISHNEKTAKRVGGFSRIVGLSTGNWIG